MLGQQQVLSSGLPWWAVDMVPQGYMGRAYAARHGAELGLPARLADWTDAQALRALLAHGHDAPGDLLLGDVALAQFRATPVPVAIPLCQRAETYARMARGQAVGELAGAVGGEQPKFTAYAMTPAGPRQALVKFSTSERWHDLLLAEHLALRTLREAGISAARTQVLDYEDLRFLEVERFDRVGAVGRRGVASLAALDAEFGGIGLGSWPALVAPLAEGGHVQERAVAQAALLWAFGTLIGNSDMHASNLSFMAEPGRPYALAPVYDMLPMAFAPRAGVGLPDALPAVEVYAEVVDEVWRQALELARAFLARMRGAEGFSAGFGVCVEALERRVAGVGEAIG